MQRMATNDYEVHLRRRKFEAVSVFLSGSRTLNGTTTAHDEVRKVDRDQDRNISSEDVLQRIIAA